MSSSGIANASGVSTKQFETALYLNAAIFGAQILGFTLLRTGLPLIYQPRSVLPIESKRQEPLSDKIWRWPYEVFMADYSQVKRTNGMDAYFYLRFLRMAVRVFIPIWFLSWAVLLPVTSVHTSVNNTTGLDRFVFGNVGSDEQSRYWAHILLAYVFTGWICYNIKYEMRHFVQSRQHHLISKAHSNSAQSRTLLITGIPSRYLTERQLFAIFSYLPGGVHKVWLNRDLKDLPGVFNAKLKAINQLEAAETKLLVTAAQIAKEQENKGEVTPSAKAQSNPMEKQQQRPMSGESSVPLSPAIDVECALPRAEAIVPKDRRPRHKLKVYSWLPFGIPFTGKSVDTIEWSRSEIARCNAILRDGRAQWREDMATDDDSADDFYKPLNSAFILFNQQIAAHLALQSVIHHDAYRMAGKYIEVAQEDVIWSNLSLNPYERRIRTVISWGITIGLVILWAFPAAFIGAISNVQGLCAKYHWLAWLCTLNDNTISVITGFLPPVLLALLMIVLPIILRLLARFEGIPSRSGLELSLMDRFFGFQIIHSFFVVTLSSGLIKALPDLLENPASVPALLAHNLPSASNFFLTYVILQGLTGSAAGFLQIVTLIIYYLRVILAGSTPRSLYNTKFGPHTLTLGTVFPATTLLMCITIAYSIISPIINGLACATFFLFYMLNKYLFLWCMQQPQSEDTGGLFFPKAIQHVFIGLYIEQICLAALFFLARNVKEDPSAIPEAILCLFLIGFTLLFQVTLNDSYRPLITALPLTLADKTYGIKKDDAVEDGGEPAAPTGDKLQNQDGTEAFPEKFTGEASGVERYELQPRRGRTGDSTSSKQDKAPRLDSSSRKPSGHEHNIEEESTAESVLGEATADETPEDEGPTDFTHPAVSNHPHIVWIPMDKLGFARDEVESIRALGIDVSFDGATLNDKGHVEITAAPPDIGDI